MIMHAKSSFADHQILKLQEAPDMVPVGELPRHMMLSVDRSVSTTAHMRVLICAKIPDGTRRARLAGNRDGYILYVPVSQERKRELTCISRSSEQSLENERLCRRGDA